MKRRILLPLLFGFLLFSGPGISGQKNKTASTPEEAVRYLVEASRAGDVEAAFAQYPAVIRQMLPSILAQDKLQAEFDKALDDKFGPSPAPLVSMPRTMRALLKSTREVTILEKTAKGKDFVVLKVKVVASLIPGKEGALETYMVGLKENNVWRVTAVGAEPKPKILANAEAARAFLTKEVESIKKGAAKRQQALKKIIAAVTEGKYKSRAEALDALHAILFPTNAPKKDSHLDCQNTGRSMARRGMTR